MLRGPSKNRQFQHLRNLRMQTQMDLGIQRTVREIPGEVSPEWTQLQTGAH